MHFCFIVGGDGIYSVACWDVSQFVDNAHLLHLYDDGIHLHSIKVNLTMSRFCGVVLVNAETRLGVWTTFELPSYALTRLAAAGRPETFLYSPLDGFRCALSCTIFNNLLTCILHFMPRNLFYMCDACIVLCTIQWQPRSHIGKNLDAFSKVLKALV